MDIGMWIKDYNKQLIDEFQNNGLYLEHLFGRVKSNILGPSSEMKGQFSKTSLERKQK
jgi:hypothetical protein